MDGTLLATSVATTRKRVATTTSASTKSPTMAGVRIRLRSMCPSSVWTSQVAPCLLRRETYTTKQPAARTLWTSSLRSMVVSATAFTTGTEGSVDALHSIAPTTSTTRMGSLQTRKRVPTIACCIDTSVPLTWSFIRTKVAAFGMGRSLRTTIVDKLSCPFLQRGPPEFDPRDPGQRLPDN